MQEYFVENYTCYIISDLKAEVPQFKNKYYEINKKTYTKIEWID